MVYEVERYMQSAFSADDISLSGCLRADTLNQHRERSTHWCQSVRPGSEELDWQDGFQTPTSWKASRSRKKETGSGSSVDKWFKYWRTWTSPDTHSVSLSWDKKTEKERPTTAQFIGPASGCGLWAVQVVQVSLSVTSSAACGQSSSTPPSSSSSSHRTTLPGSWWRQRAQLLLAPQRCPDVRGPSVEDPCIHAPLGPDAV